VSGYYNIKKKWQIDSEKDLCNDGRIVSCNINNTLKTSSAGHVCVVEMLKETG
jgi:hypothetical protein